MYYVLNYFGFNKIMLLQHKKKKKIRRHEVQKTKCTKLTLPALQYCLPPNYNKCLTKIYN